MAKQRKISETDLILSEKIRSRRLELGLSQEELAREIGLSFQQVQKYERAQNRVSSSKLVEIARALKVDVTYFIGPEYNVPQELGFLFASESSDQYGEVNAEKTREMIELMQYFNRITDETLRSQIISLAKSFVEKDS
jgi:transcriptional regulator with XRE-family HTH domain